MSEDSAFNLLHDGVRRQIYNMGWTELRPMQVAAIRSILGTDNHIVLSAGTASGKTEAAFLPILSAIADEPVGSFHAIYVGPLKALINDQFARVEELCGYLGLPVHRWHGDVSMSAKTKTIRNPGGVLLITPESLESLFVNRSNALATIFGGLQFVVIDELHSFLDHERGLHLRSLLYRVAVRTRQPLRLIGLSATIGDPKIAKEYLDRDMPDRVHLITGDQDEPELKVRLHAYVVQPRSEPVDNATDDSDDSPARAGELATDIVAHCHGSSNLIFANSRNEVEYYGDLCQRIAQAECLSDQFIVHHGSLSADLRHEAETQMKSSSQTGKPVTTFCSSTLEMGIDIGSVRMVGQIGPPFSVASLKQRVGRSGRRKDSARILRAYLECRRVDEKSDLFDRLHLPLIQTIAVIELMIQRWVEPAQPSSFDLSTLTQQIISLISEAGGVQAREAFQILCERGAFRDAQPTDFAKLLRQLAAVDVIEQIPTGELILGLLGEDIRKDKGFYATFMTADAFAVFHKGERIGSVDRPPEIKQHMILGGRRWEVTDVDEKQHAIYVVPAHGRKGAPFAGNSGVLHSRVVAEMRAVLQSQKSYKYLNSTAAKLLDDARQTASVLGICTKPLLSLDKARTAFLPWVGSRTLDTLHALLKAAGLEVTIQHRIALSISKPVDQCAEFFTAIISGVLNEAKILESLSGPPPEKYDSLLNDELRYEILKRRWLDVPAATAALNIQPSADTRQLLL